MHNSLSRFQLSINETKGIIAIYDYLVTEVRAPINLDDLLRSKIVYSVSAFDKLMHDLVRVGMVEIYEGRRAATPKYLNEPIQIAVVQQLLANTPAMAANAFEQAVSAKLKILSFQDPDKVSDGLSFIWLESQKWQKISAAVGINESQLRTTLKLIVSRRNSIVHESDFDPVSGGKNPISKQEAMDIVGLIERLGIAIAGLVI